MDGILEDVGLVFQGEGIIHEDEHATALGLDLSEVFGGSIIFYPHCIGV